MLDFNLENLFIKIISKGKKSNTYKFALAKFLLDYSNKANIEDIEIFYDEIAEAFLQYYWLQECRYKIKQDFTKNSQPEVIRIIREHCGTYYIPSSYEKYFENKEEKKLEIIKEISNKCFKDVIPRFQENENKFYKHNHSKLASGNYKMPKTEDRYILFSEEAIKFCKKNYKLLYKALILEWAKFLEKTNFTPKLIEKIENNKKERGTLKKYKDILLEMGNCCFYCGKSLKKKG